MRREEAGRLISRFHSLNVLVLGDFMLDRFIWGRVQRISPEAPVPVVEVERETSALGGAGNVVMNLHALGASVLPVGIIGEDPAGKEIERLLAAVNIRGGLLQKCTRQTTQKTRIIAHNQQVVRVDREVQQPASEEEELMVVRATLDLLPPVHAVVISDYAKGCITPRVLQEVLPSARLAGKIVCVDPKPRLFPYYSPVSAITPNQPEAESVLGYEIHSEHDLAKAAHRITNLIDCDALLITRGEKGMALFSDGEMKLFPARAKEVYDVTGAGDTVISVLTLALAAGARVIDAVELTIVAAGIVVGKLGTASVTPEELLNEFE